MYSIFNNSAHIKLDSGGTGLTNGFYLFVNHCSLHLCSFAYICSYILVLIVFTKVKMCSQVPCLLLILMIRPKLQSSY